MLSFNLTPVRSRASEFDSIMTTERAYFVREGDLYRATENTRGPWSNTHQHGGPPGALIGRELERLALEHLGDGAFPSRFTIEFLRPIPIGLLKVEAEPIKLGKKVLRLEGRLTCDGKEVCRGWALFTRTRDLDVPENVLSRGQSHPGPETGRDEPFPFFLHDVGYHTATEVRILEGAYGSGRVLAWMAPRVPLVLGEEATALQRILTVCDSGNGLSYALDKNEYSFVNPDLTIHLWRKPESHHVCMDARTEITGRSVGLAHVKLSDTNGPIGLSMQSLLFERNPS